MASISCGIAADTFGSLMMFAFFGPTVRKMGDRDGG
jgi:hypothetical protein